MEHTPPRNTLHVHHVTTSVWSYWPIATIYAAAALFALFTIKFHLYPDYMSHWMGFVLIGFGLIKLSDVVGFANGFSMYDPIAKRSTTYAQSYPFIEIALGILFILQLLVVPVTLITLFIYSTSLYGALQSIKNKETLHCVCLGTYFKLPLSTVSVLESGFMISMCIWMLLMINTMATMAM
jgi:hypothetical protein